MVTTLVSTLESTLETLSFSSLALPLSVVLSIFWILNGVSSLDGTSTFAGSSSLDGVSTLTKSSLICFSSFTGSLIWNNSFFSWILESVSTSLSKVVSNFVSTIVSLFPDFFSILFTSLISSLALVLSSAKGSGSFFLLSTISVLTGGCSAIVDVSVQIFAVSVLSSLCSSSGSTTFGSALTESFLMSSLDSSIGLATLGSTIASVLISSFVSLGVSFTLGSVVESLLVSPLTSVWNLIVLGSTIESFLLTSLVVVDGLTAVSFLISFVSPNDSSKILTGSPLSIPTSGGVNLLISSDFFSSSVLSFNSTLPSVFTFCSSSSFNKVETFSGLVFSWTSLMAALVSLFGVSEFLISSLSESLLRLFNSRKLSSVFSSICSSNDPNDTIDFLSFNWATSSSLLVVLVFGAVVVSSDSDTVSFSSSVNGVSAVVELSMSL